MRTGTPICPVLKTTRCAGTSPASALSNPPYGMETSWQAGRGITAGFSLKF